MFDLSGAGLRRDIFSLRILPTSRDQPDTGVKQEKMMMQYTFVEQREVVIKILSNKCLELDSK